MKPIATLAPLALIIAACGNNAAEDANIEARMDALEVEAAELEADAQQMITEMSESRAMERGTFEVKNSSGFTIGTAMIADTMDGVDVTLDLTSIPEGNHAIHFHETGTCDGPDFKSAGGHYNPANVNHGFDAPSPRPHAGDMRNFDAPASGVVQQTIENARVSLAGYGDRAPLRDANGSALIIHAEPDDYETQPTGAAGARIACAVID